MECLIAELAGRAGAWDVSFAVLGPAGAGKTAIVRAALEQAARARIRPVYVDLRQARELWNTDKFFGWLLKSIRDVLEPNGARRNGHRTKLSVSPRMEWCDAMARLLARRRERVLLALDHVESIADNCAHDLISDLREIQDRSSAESVWSRLRCVLSGTVSVYQLRRRANSPNLQFVIRRLPAWTTADAEAETRKHFVALGRDLEDDAAAALARLTCGEPAFLNLAGHYLPSPSVTAQDVERLPPLVVKDAMRYLELAAPATLYALDARFREHAHDMIDGRPASWCDPAADIEPYQLAGALVTGEAARHEARFRNELVRHTLVALRAATLSRHEVTSELAQVPSILLQRRCLQALNVRELLEGLAEGWLQLARVGAQPKLLLRDAVETRALLLDHDTIAVEQKARSITPALELSLGRIGLRVLRVEREWFIDTQMTNQVAVGVRLVCGDDFVPTVSMREVLRVWALFLEPLEKTLQGVGLEALGRAALKGRLPHGGKRVFVSSTYADLKEHRQLVMEQIVRRDLLFRGMEHFGADSDRPSAKIVEEVRESDIYLGIFGAKYGSIDAANGLSMTELEFNEAEARGMPMLLYVPAPEATVKRSDVEADGEATRKLGALLARVKSRVVYQFTSPMDLARQVYTDLQKYT